MKTFSFVCVQVGDKYPDHYVRRLQAMVRRHCSAPFSFACVTDSPVLWSEKPVGIELIRPPNDYPGWWQKINLFDHSLLKQRHLFYLDLDTIILKSLDGLVSRLGEADLLYAQDPLDVLSSSVMLIDTSSDLAKELFQSFSADLVSPDEGDQWHIGKFIGPRYHTRGLDLADHYSYKYLIDLNGWRSRTTNPNYRSLEPAEVVTLNFHGNPKPVDLLQNPTWPLRDWLMAKWEIESDPGPKHSAKLS